MGEVTHLNHFAVRVDEVNLSAEGLWLDLGQLRDLVELASGMPEDADVLVASERSETAGEDRITKVIVRSQTILEGPTP